jgi:hypothetical protein
MLGRIVFDHRPPLARRERGDDANYPDRSTAICGTCDKQKTPRDLKQIAKAKRLALHCPDLSIACATRPRAAKSKWVQPTATRQISSSPAHEGELFDQNRRNEMALWRRNGQFRLIRHLT